MNNNFIETLNKILGSAHRSYRYNYFNERIESYFLIVLRARRNVTETRTAIFSCLLKHHAN